MPDKRRPRLMISLDDDSLELLRRLEAFTGLSPAQTIQKIFPAHVQELWEYLTWLEQLPKTRSVQRDLGPFLLHSYGPDSLIDAIKRIDPTYQTDGDKFDSGLRNSANNAETKNENR